MRANDDAPFVIPPIQILNKLSHRRRVHIAPIGADFDVDEQRDVERMDLLHSVLDEGLEALEFFGGALEKKLVVDLQNHARAKFFRDQAAVDFDHGEFDEIGGGSLERRVHRGAFGEIAQVGLRRIDFGNRADAAEHGARDAGLARFGDLAFEIFFDAAVAVEVSGDEFRGFFLVDLQILREAKGGEAVDDAEINYFGGAAMLGSLGKGRDVENFLCGARVNVLGAAKGFDENRVLGKMREDAQLDLGIIGGKQNVARLGDEGGANFAAELGANRNVLQIGIRGAETSGGSAGLIDLRVQAASVRGDELVERVRIRGIEFRDFAIIHHQLGQFVERGKLGEDFGGGGARFATRAAREREIQLVVKDFGKLLRRIDIEFEAGNFVDAFFVAANFLFESEGEFFEGLWIDADSGALHARENCGERQIDFVVGRGDFPFRLRRTEPERGG